VRASGEPEPGSFGGREAGFRENQVDAGQGGCLPGEIGPAAAPGTLEPAAGLVTAGGDARYQGQRGPTPSRAYLNFQRTDTRRATDPDGLMDA